MDIIDLKSQLENEDNAKKRAELLAQHEFALQRFALSPLAEQATLLVSWHYLNFLVELLNQ